MTSSLNRFGMNSKVNWQSNIGAQPLQTHLPTEWAQISIKTFQVLKPSEESGCSYILIAL